MPPSSSKLSLAERSNGSRVIAFESLKTGVGNRPTNIEMSAWSLVEFASAILIPSGSACQETGTVPIAWSLGTVQVKLTL